MLPVAPHLVDALFSFVTDGCNLISRLIGRDNLSGYFGFSHCGRADLNTVAVNSQQRLKIHSLSGIFKQLDVESLALGDDVLLPTCRNNCFFHKRL